MNWIVALILGLIIGWFLELLIDWFFWRYRDVDGTATVDCSEISADYEKQIKGLNASLDGCKANVEARDVEISGLTASLKAKDQELADLNTSFEAKNLEFSGLAASAGDRDAEVEGLRSRLLGRVKSPGWFDWGEYDFFNWGEGDDVEFVGTGDAGGTVDVSYAGKNVGTADVDDGGNWKLGWLVPGAFLPGMLGFIRRDRDGVEVDATRGEMSAAIDAAAPSVAVSAMAPAVELDVETAEVEAEVDVDIDAGGAAAGLGLAGIAAAGAAAVGLGGAFVDLVNDSSQTTIRLEDIEGDDLTKIWGIGPKTKLNFYRRGITTFDQFANIDKDTLAEIMAESRLMSARIPQDPHGSWTALAGLAAKGDWDGFNAMTTKIKPPEPARKKKRKKSIKLDGDKLSDIAGIGRGTWKALHDRGYNSYAKLADISVEEVEAVMRKSRALNAPGAPTPAEAHASWTELARLAASGDMNAFNARNAGLTESVVTETVTQPTRFDALGYDFSGWEAGQERSFYGREAAGAVINFFYDGQNVGNAVAGEDGTWEFPFTVPEGFTPSLMTFTMS